MTTTTIPASLAPILEARRGLLSLEPAADAFGAIVSVIPGLAGAVVAETEQDARDLLVALDGLLHKREHGPARCVCGALYAEHEWDSRSKRDRGRCERTNCGGYKAAS